MLRFIDRFCASRPALRVAFVVFLCLSAKNLLADSPIDAIITLEADPPFTSRHHLLHRLPASILGAHSEELIDFMRAEEVPGGMREGEYMSLVNDIYNLLLSNGIEVQQLFDICLEVIPDESAGEIWRDYCMQKLNYTLGREDIATESIQEALKLLDAATQGAYPRMQGTAFIAAYQFRDHPFDPKPEFLNEKILGERALEAAKNEKIPLIDRITALQTATKCKSVGTLDYATTLLASSEPVEPMLKVVALATVGQLGDEAQIPLLSEYRLSPDVRFRKASREAVTRIESTSRPQI